MTNFVYLMGHGFSGSTLLTFLLNGHPQIATIGEMVIATRSKVRPEDFVCSCGIPLAGCGFWQRVSREMAGRGFHFDMRDSDLVPRADDFPDRLLRAQLRPRPLELGRRLALATLPSARRRLADHLARNQAVVEVITGIKGCNTFLDSTKRPERALVLARAPRFDTRIIHLVRDGRAVAYSCAKNLDMTPGQGAASWLADARSCERARGHFPADRWLTVRHEDLCADPCATLARIFRFIGVPPAAVEDFRTGEHHIIGNRMRLATTSEIRLDERWRTALAPPDLVAVDRLVAPVNRRYGYGPLDQPGPLAQACAI